MAIARRLRWFLDQSKRWYEVLPHPRSASSLETARHAHVPAAWLAKPVLLEDELGYLMAVVPASNRLDLKRLREELHRELELAREDEITSLFPDCAEGAMPPLGTPYKIPLVYDDALRSLSDVYFEAGDHEDLVHMEGPDFVEMLAGSLHGRFTQSL